MSFFMASLIRDFKIVILIKLIRIQRHSKSIQGSVKRLGIKKCLTNTA